MAKYSLNSGYFDHLTTPGQAYVLGFSSRKTYEDLVPTYGEHDLAFIRGIIDGDGSIWFSGDNWSMQVTGNTSIYNYFGRGGIYRDGSVSKWQVGGRKQIGDIAQELLSCPGRLPLVRKAKLLEEICNG